MEIRIKKLIESFESNGWKLIGSADLQPDWWFDDVLVLKSIWRPVDKEIYLTLLTDPMYDKKVVWSIGISKYIPDNKNIAWINQITLNEISKTNLKDFVISINERVFEEK